MAYDERIIERATARLRAAADEKHAEYEAHLAKAYEQYPRLQAIDRRLRESAAEAVAVSFRKGGDTRAAIEQLQKENLALQNERQWILDASEFDEDFLDDSPVCKLCGGKGWVGAQMCECLRELCRQEQKKELSSLLLGGNERFENFQLHYYPDEFDPALGASARHMMKLNLSACRRFAGQFKPGAGSLLFTGATGLGKTFLSACIARQVADMGYSVCYITAGKLFSDYERVRFSGGDEDDLRKYTECDLLIIDDLGTEMRTQFVVSALYTVVNERLLHQKSTIISTNLRPEDLESRYTPQIASRLLGCYQLHTFAGNDIRPMLR